MSIDLDIVSNVLIGTDGELYLAGGNHSVLKFATGEFRVREESIVNMRENLAFRRGMAARYGFAYMHMIAPEKYRVVSEAFPVKEISSLAEQYKAGGCEGMIDPVAEFRSALPMRSYYQTDSHWAPHGKIIAARLIAEGAGHDPLDIAASEAEALKSLKPTPDRFCGDLGRKLNPKRDEETFTYKPEHVIHTFENGLPHDFENPINDGRIVLTESDADCAEGTLLIFGDSYLHQSLVALTFFFKRIIFCRTRWFHEEIVGMTQPDIVVTQQAERYLSFVYPDSGAPNFLFLPQMLGRHPAPSQSEALALAKAFGFGRELDMRPFARQLTPS